MAEPVTLQVPADPSDVGLMAAMEAIVKHYIERGHPAPLDGNEVALAVSWLHSKYGKLEDVNG